MKKVLFEMTDELLKVIDAAKGKAARNPWMEKKLWQARAVRSAAEQLGIENPQRPKERRGKYKRRAKT